MTKKNLIKIVSVMLVLVLLLCSCGEDAKKNTPDADPTETVLATATPDENNDKTDVPDETSTELPTETPTEAPTEKPTDEPTKEPTKKPTSTATTESTPTPTENPYAKNTYIIKNNLSSIKLIGRTTMVGKYVSCDWSASGIEFTANCKGTVSLKIQANGGDPGMTHGCGYFTVYIDGVRQSKRIQVTNSGTREVKIATNLQAGEHTFRFLKQTYVKNARFTIQSIIMNGTLSEKAPAQQKYYMEIIGDSITSGHGILSQYKGTPESFDATSSYAFLAAETLKADYSIVSVDGIGVTKGYQTETMPQVYPYTCYYRNDTTKYTPGRQADVVVINLGTNDATKGSNSATYIKDVKTLIGQVRDIYKDVPIVWIYNSMRADHNQHTKTAIDELLASGYKDLYMLKFTANTAGGNGHPSAAAHIADAEVLSNYIKEKGWMK